MKQFNYDLLENKKHLLEQDNSGSDEYIMVQTERMHP